MLSLPAPSARQRAGQARGSSRRGRPETVARGCGLYIYIYTYIHIHISLAFMLFLPAPSARQRVGQARGPSHIGRLETVARGCGLYIYIYIHTYVYIYSWPLCCSCPHLLPGSERARREGRPVEGDRKRWREAVDFA